MLQLLHVAALCLLLFLPSLCCENLVCHFSPILEKDKMVEPTVTECPPKQVCFEGVGRYGNYSALSARGCMLQDQCSKKVYIRLKGTVYIMSYSCCDWPHCNSCVAVRPLLATVTLAAVAALTSRLS
uniref:UPAR/Ly6 domain-containing protein n=2 Tax=Nothobranchius furzeri TaxID=105023 RepID=A0A8C6P3P8_NOTFU